MLVYVMSGNYSSYSHVTPDSKMSPVYPISVSYQSPTRYTVASVHTPFKLTDLHMQLVDIKDSSV